MEPPHSFLGETYPAGEVPEVGQLAEHLQAVGGGGVVGVHLYTLDGEAGEVGEAGGEDLQGVHVLLKEQAADGEVAEARAGGGQHAQHLEALHQGEHDAPGSLCRIPRNP